MASLKYTVIKYRMQYDTYCKALELLLEHGAVDSDEIELLSVLIDHYDATHRYLTEADPIELLKSFMHDHGLKGKDLVEVLGVSKGYVSEILNYKKGLSKDVIRKLSAKFNVSQEAFNRPYKLRGSEIPLQPALA